jgi:L-lactate dehydrogenase complex protein LldE
MNVSLFIPCITDQLFPQSGMNMVSVLERAGCTVEYLDKQTCCGQPAFNTGYHDEARDLAIRHIDLFLSSTADYIVSPSGSCTTMVNVMYGEQLSLPDAYIQKVEALRKKTFEFTAFMTEILHKTDLGAVFPHKVTMHDSCHALRELNVKQQPRELLAKVKGLELVEMEHAETCCGFGGTFSVKYADISTEMVKRKVDEIIASGAEYVTAVDSSCLMQIDGYLRKSGSSIRAIHIADILAAQEGT